jgi:hypothetical protein
MANSYTVKFTTARTKSPMPSITVAWQWIPTVSSASVPTSLPAGHHLTTGPQRATHWLWLTLTRNQDQSYFTTGSLPPISSSWRQVPRDPRQAIIFTTEPLRSYSLCNILPDEKMRPSFTTATDPRQRSHSLNRVPRNSWTYFTVSDSRLPQTWGSRPRIYIPPGAGWPSYTPRNRIPFSSPPTTRRATVEYSNPPPQGLLMTNSDLLLVSLL